MRKLFLSIILLAASFGTKAQLSFDETLQYMQENLNGVTQRYKSVDLDHYHQKKELKVTYKEDIYTLGHKSYCNFEISAKHSMNHPNSVYRVELSKIPTITLSSSRAVNKPGPGYDDITSTVVFELDIEGGTYLEKYENFQKRIDNGSSMKVIQQVFSDSDRNPWIFGFHIFIENQVTAERLAKAFQNLKETCPKDPFA